MPRWAQLNHSLLVCQLHRHRRHLDIVKTAGHDRIEALQINRDVECESVKRHPASNTDPNRSDLAFGATTQSTAGSIDEDPGPARQPSRRYVQVFERLDQGRFETPQMRMDIATAECIEIEDRIADELPGRVKRHVTAPPDLEEFDLEFAQPGFAESEMRTIRAAAQGDDPWMFEQKEPVSGATRQTVGHGRVLKGERIRVGRLTHPLDRQRLAHR